MSKNPAEDNQNRTGDKESGQSRGKTLPRVNLPKMDKKTGWRGFIIYAILGIILFGFFALSTNPAERFLKTEPISKVISDIKDNKIDQIEIDGDRLNVALKDKSVYASRKEESQSFFAALEADKVDLSGTQIVVKDRTFSQAWVTILTTFLPLGIIIFFFFFVFRQAREGASSVFSFGQ